MTKTLFKRDFFLLGLILLIFLPLQAQKFDWAESIDGPGSESSSSACFDRNNNIYIIGYFNDTIDVDPGSGTTYLTPVGDYDVFVEKIDSSGNLLWAKSFGGNGGDIGESICLDSLGNIYIAGYFQGTADFDPGPGVNNLTSLGAEDFFVQKMDSSGNFLWAKSFGGISQDKTYANCTDGYGNIYITGHFGNTVDFDPSSNTFNLTSAGNSDFFIQKIDSLGNLLWVKSFGDVADDIGFSISCDNSGNVYTSGYFQGTVDFDPGTSIYNLTSMGSGDIFVLKLDSLGNFLWADSFGGTSNDLGGCLRIDNQNNTYLTGYFQGNANFSSGGGPSNVASVGFSDIFVLKLDSTGSVLWVNSFGGNDFDIGTCLTVDTLGNVYTTGYFRGTADFDPGMDTVNLISTGGSEDIFIQKLDASGNLLWAKSFGGTSSDIGNTINVDISGNLYTTGQFEGNGDFNAGSGTCLLTSAGSVDIFIQKMNPCSSIGGIDTVVACNSYTWVDNLTYFSSTNNVSFLIPTTDGCDSIIFLNLTILQSPVANLVLNSDGSLTANGGVTYQWISCATGLLEPNGSSNSFYPIATGDYACIVGNGICSDTSDCFHYALGLDEAINNGWSILPNPTKGIVKIQTEGNQADLFIYDITGKLIDSMSIINDQIFDLSKYESGTYIFELKSLFGASLKRVVYNQ